MFYIWHNQHILLTKGARMAYIFDKWYIGIYLSWFWRSKMYTVMKNQLDGYELAQGLDDWRSDGVDKKEAKN